MQPAACVGKHNVIGAQPHPFTCIMAAFELQGQLSTVASTDQVESASPPTFTLWPSAEKGCPAL